MNQSKPIQRLRHRVIGLAEGVHPQTARRAFRVSVALAAVLTLFPGTVWAADKAASPACVRYSLPQELLEKPFFFAGELIPLERPDVRLRVTNQLNFLLLDARGALTEWLSEKTRYSWIFDEILEKESVPREFALFSPVLAGLTRNASRSSPAGWWALDKPCDRSEGVEMSEDSWRDDRYEFELATRCFSTRIKRIHSDLADSGWLLTAAAYVTSTKTIQDLMQRWNARSYWDMPLPDAAEELIVRWIAFGIISGHRRAFGLQLKETPPLVFDQITALTFGKDLPIAQLADMAGVSSREILQMNPKIKPGSGSFPAKDQGKAVVHTLAVPKGKGWVVVNKLKEGGYLKAPDTP